MTERVQAPHAVLVLLNLPVPDDQRAWSQALALRDDGARVTVVCPAIRGRRPGSERIDGIDVIRFRSFEGQNPLATAAEGLWTAAAAGEAARRALRSSRTPRRMLQIGNPPDLLFPLAWWARRQGIRTVYDQRDVVPVLAASREGFSRLTPLFLAAEQRMISTADVVITPSEEQRGRILQRYGRDALIIRTAEVPAARRDDPTAPRALHETPADAANAEAVSLPATEASAQPPAPDTATALVSAGDPASATVPEASAQPPAPDAADTLASAGDPASATVPEASAQPPAPGTAATLASSGDLAPATAPEAPAQPPAPDAAPALASPGDPASAPETAREPSPSAADASPNLVIGYLGVVGEQDGLTDLLDAVALLHTDGVTGFHVEVAGDGPALPAARTHAARLGLDPLVTFHGWLGPGAVDAFLGRIDAMAVPDPDNPFNHFCAMNKVTHAMARGVPIALRPLRENVRLTAGHAYEAADMTTRAFADALAALLKDTPAARAEIAAAARATFEAHHSWPRYAPAYVAAVSPARH